jgi:two-component system sensor histidine kinase SenX3
MTVEVDVPEGLPAVRGDARALRRALENVITNAVKFARQGGWIGVRAHAGEDGRTVTLRVEDRGPGIPRSDREKVFDPFYRGADARRSQTPGSGLGLSLVRHVVEAHGGRVELGGGQGGGAVVTLELPSMEAGTEHSP